MSADCPKGFVARTIEWNGQSYNYSVYVPPGYTPGKRWPGILFLHGAGERGVDGNLQTTVGLGRVVRTHPDWFPCVVILPQCPPDKCWTPDMEGLALAALSEAERDYNLDPRRIVLTGLSLGGFGTWSIGAQFPQRFAALAPVCGGGDTSTAASLAGVPTWCFHGDADPVVDVKRSREMVAAVRAASGNVQYTEFAGVGHNSWDPAYGDRALIDWMLAQRRR